MPTRVQPKGRTTSGLFPTLMTSNKHRTQLTLDVIMKDNLIRIKIKYTDTQYTQQDTLIRLRICAA